MTRKTNQSGYAPKENDLYETETWAIDRLFEAFPFLLDDRIWEPSAGNHRIADNVRDRLGDVFTSDIATYTRQHDFVIDFFTPDYGYFAATVEPVRIITNPPYGYQNHTAVKYARLALKRADWVVLLLTMKFDSAKTRKDLFRHNSRFYAKLVLEDRLSFFDDKDGKEDHAWFLWGPGPYKAPIIKYAGKEK